MAAAVPAERPDPLSHIRDFFFNAAFNFILTRVRGDIFPGNLREAGTLLAPMWLMNIICRNLCGAVLVTLRAGKAMATNYPPPSSQGQGWWVCQSSWSLDLLCCASPFLFRTDPCLTKCIHSYLPEQTGKIQSSLFPCPFPGGDHT